MFLKYVIKFELIDVNYTYIISKVHIKLKEKKHTHAIFKIII
jgi:hypothetical protein